MHLFVVFNYLNVGYNALINLNLYRNTKIFLQLLNDSVGDI